MKSTIKHRDLLTVKESLLFSKYSLDELERVREYFKNFSYNADSFLDISCSNTRIWHAVGGISHNGIWIKEKENLFLEYLSELNELNSLFVQNPSDFLYLKIKKLRSLLLEIERRISKRINRTIRTIRHLKKKLLQYRSVNVFDFIRSIIRNHFQTGIALSGCDEDVVSLLKDNFNIWYNYLIHTTHEKAYKKTYS